MYTQPLGLSIGRHVSVRANINGNNIIRAYTPTSSPFQKGSFELLIKAYPDGKLTPYLHSIKVGDVLDIRGPVGRFKYTTNQFGHMGFIAGGTGITPCLQVIRTILEGEEYRNDTTKFTLFFQNRSVEVFCYKNLYYTNSSTRTLSYIFFVVLKDVLLRSLSYFLSKYSDSWGRQENEVKGYIDEKVAITPFSRVCVYFLRIIYVH